VNLGEIEATMRLMEDTIADVVVLVVKRGEPQQAVVAFCRPSEFFVMIINLTQKLIFIFLKCRFLKNVLYHGCHFFPRTT